MGKIWRNNKKNELWDGGGGGGGLGCGGVWMVDLWGGVGLRLVGDEMNVGERVQHNGE
jgi:hypothetical protein